MALLEDMLKGNVVTAVAMGATALVLPKVLPDLSPSMRSMVKGVVSLFLELESEAEGGIIDRLAENALKAVLGGLNGSGSPRERQQAAQHAVEDFKRTAHRRARRYGRNEAEQASRYRRHVATFRRAMNRAGAERKGPGAEMLQGLSAGLATA